LSFGVSARHGEFLRREFRLSAAAVSDAILLKEACFSFPVRVEGLKYERLSPLGQALDTFREAGETAGRHLAGPTGRRLRAIFTITAIRPGSSGNIFLEKLIRDSTPRAESRNGIILPSRRG